MNRPAISILIPHLRTPANDAALKVALDCIVDNTNVDYELIIMADNGGGEVYALYNDMAQRARADLICLSNSDVFFAPGWAEPMIAAFSDPGMIVTGVLVEPGAIPVSDQNIHFDYGITPETFRRAEFEEYTENVNVALPRGEGWYMPCLMYRHEFMRLGSFDLTRGAFPAQLDVDFWQRWRASGRTVQRVRSFAYHLQNYSNPEIKREA